MPTESAERRLRLDLDGNETLLARRVEARGERCKRTCCAGSDSELTVPGGTQVRALPSGRQVRWLL